MTLIIPTSNEQARVFGLDLLRALAIALVFVGHGVGVFLPQHTIWVFRLLPDGVSLFFCLSGYLITIAFLDHMQKWGASGTAISHFWLKRAIRTIPPFFIALIIHGALIAGFARVDVPAASVWSFVFLQNFAWPMRGGFSEGWSLSVEEWFYALFMLITFVALKCRMTRLGAFVASAAILALLALAYRTLVYTGAFGPLDLQSVSVWVSYIQSTVLGRLDAPAVGVAFAIFSRAWPQLWTSHALSRWCLVIGVIAAWGLQNITVFMMMPANDAGPAVCDAAHVLPQCLQLFSSADFFFAQPTLVSLAWGLLLVPASRMMAPRSQLITSMVRQTAASAFSIYLTHLSIVAFLIVPAVSTLNPVWAPIVSYIVLGCIISQLFFVLVERPALRLRRHIDVWFAAKSAG